MVRHYIKNSIDTNELPLINRITKYIYVPFYFISIYAYKTLNTSLDKYLFKVGFISFCIRLIFLASQILARFGLYFEILSLFPLYYLLIYLLYWKKHNKEVRFFLISIFLIINIVLLFAKVVLLPVGEFHYKSIIPQIMGINWLNNIGIINVFQE
jgi:hypothetical protein